MLSSRHVGPQGGCVGVGCLVSDTPGAPHAGMVSRACGPRPCTMQGTMHRSGPPRRMRVDSPAHVISLEVGFCSIVRSNVVICCYSIFRSVAFGPRAGVGFAHRCVFRSLDIRLAAATAVGRGPVTARACNLVVPRDVVVVHEFTHPPDS